MACPIIGRLAFGTMVYVATVGGRVTVTTLTNSGRSCDPTNVLLDSSATADDDDDDNHRRSTSGSHGGRSSSSSSTTYKLWNRSSSHSLLSSWSSYDRQVLNKKMECHDDDDGNNHYHSPAPAVARNKSSKRYHFYDWNVPPITSATTHSRVPSVTPLSNETSVVKKLICVDDYDNQQQQQQQDETIEPSVAETEENEKEEEQQQQQPQHQPINFSGVYKLVSSTNLDEFLEAQGISWAVRQAVHQARPIHRITHQDGILTIQIEGVVMCDSQTSYQINGPPVTTYVLGRQFLDYARYTNDNDDDDDQNKTKRGIVISKTALTDGHYDVTITRQLSEDGQQIILTSRVYVPHLSRKHLHHHDSDNNNNHADADHYSNVHFGNDETPFVQAVQVFQRVDDKDPS